MKKIVMIVPNCLPIPAVKGGAVETLVTHIINENEKEKKVVLEIFSIADELTDKDKNKYKYTNIHYIKVPINKKLEKLKGKWNAFTSAVFKKNNIIEKCIIYGVIKILNINSKMYLKKILKFLKKTIFSKLCKLHQNGFHHCRKKCLNFEFVLCRSSAGCHPFLL